MFLNFTKIFVCLLLLLMMQPSISFAEDESIDINENEAQNSNNEEDITVDVDINEDENSDTEDISGISIDEKNNIDIIGTDIVINNGKSQSNKDTDIFSSTFNENNKTNNDKKRSSIVSSSEISKAIDMDYSFLYDPDSNPEILADLTLNPHNYVIMYLENGAAILIKLREDYAPNTVIRFRELVKEHFYDDMEIFRAIPDYLVQTGDPSGSGYGGKGIFYFAEISPDAKFKRGTVAMANNGNLQSDDTQFFVSFGSFDWLNNKYTIFGEVILGLGKLEEVNKTFANDGFVQQPSIVTRMELLSDRPSDRVDDLSVIIPVEKQDEARKKQDKARKQEEARNKFMLENEREKEELEELKNSPYSLSVEVEDQSEEEEENISIDEQKTKQNNPYLKTSRKR